jgi:SAM-dependent methyltransferase
VTSRATSFGRRAEDYDRVRPEYPPAAVDLVVSRLGLGPEAVVLDLGAGTGKLTRPLVERFPRVIAVEPDPGMRAVLTRATEAYRVLDGKAEAIPLDDASVDAVLVGEAFHWFDTEPALGEIARVLRPCGGLGLIWKHWWETEPPVPPAAAELMKRVYERPDLERHAMETGAWRERFAASPFGELREDAIASETLTLDGHDLVTLILTTSVMASLPPESFADVEERLRALVVGEYRLPVKSGLYTTRLSK